MPLSTRKRPSSLAPVRKPLSATSVRFASSPVLFRLLRLTRRCSSYRNMRRLRLGFKSDLHPQPNRRCQQLQLYALPSLFFASFPLLLDALHAPLLLPTPLFFAHNTDLMYRTAFVDLCSKNGLASVVGTVEVGQSTSSVRRTTLSGASSTRSASRTASATPTSRVTYNPTSTSVTQVVTVPSLIASGGVAAASSSNATSAGAAASATPTGAAGRVGATLAGVLGAVAVGMVVLA